ncbi:hypothetical protein LZQ00_13785 [Sphingobacterium sp. SRCM116780]|uniref:hypothetical protein n=1 Tax=Sphingobacterium sp. SRCM116780 TaxID=2907623 RepID=UPI001F3D4FA9|nr:hypothetical protein [Sphingobacterium sp. SRCM116780]UIR55336.1 hypothetical protein LZQ00_13785 [Sphingobacterium sp. SRCM116780]
MNRILYMIIAAAISVVSCQSNTNNKQAENTKDSTIVGADKDKNGCIASAGYTWSTLKDSCVRPFEQIQLGVINNQDTYETAAYLIIDEAKHGAEVFIKENPESIVLKHVKEHEYANNDYRLIQDDHCWTLIKGGDELYKEKQ